MALDVVQEGDWDKWMMRDISLRKGRDVVIPEVSRVFHDGGEGVHVTGFFQHIFYDNIVTTQQINSTGAKINVRRSGGSPKIEIMCSLFYLERCDYIVLYYVFRLEILCYKIMC